MSFNKPQTKVAALTVLSLITLINVFGTDAYAQVTHDASKCIKVRCAFDIGSEKTKMKVFKINTCTGKIVDNKPVFPVTDEDKAAVKKLGDLPFAVDMKNVTESAKADGSYNDDEFPQFSGTLLTHAVKNILKMKELAASISPAPTDYVGVATEAFRQSNNASMIIGALENAGIKLVIPSQQQEALVEWMGTTAFVTDKDSDGNELAPKDIVSWGIGGGSMQFGMKLKDGNFGTFSSKLASINMHTKAALKLRGDASANLLEGTGLSKADIDTMVQMARTEAKKAPDDFLDRLSGSKIVIYGVGGVINNSLRGFLKLHAGTRNSFTSDDVADALKSLTGDGAHNLVYDDAIFAADPSDAAAAKYAITDKKYQELTATNLALIYGVMRQFEITKVYYADIDNTYGAPFTTDFGIKMTYQKPAPRKKKVVVASTSSKATADDSDEDDAPAPKSAAVHVETQAAASSGGTDNSATCEAFDHTMLQGGKVCSINFQIPSIDWCSNKATASRDGKCIVNGHPTLWYKI